MSASTRTLSTEFLRLHPPWVRDQERPVVRDVFLLEFESASSIEEFCVVCDDGLGNCLADGVNLGSVSSSLYAHTDVDGRESLLANNKDGFIHLETKNFGLKEVDGRAIDFDEALTLTSVSDSSSGLCNEKTFRP